VAAAGGTLYLGSSGISAINTNPEKGARVTGTTIVFADDNQKPIDMKIGVRPVFVGWVHSHAYEGPCRTGYLKDLTPEADRKRAQKRYDKWVKSVKKNLIQGREAVMLKPLYIEYGMETPEISWEAYKKLEVALSDVDLFLITGCYAPGIERYKKPVAMLGHGVVNVDIAADLRHRGLEGYALYDWDELNRLISVLRVRKAVRYTKILSVTNSPSVQSWGVASSCNLGELKRKYGMDYRYVTYKEFFHEMGRVSKNKSEQRKAEEITDKLFKNAQKVNIRRDYFINSVNFYLVTKNLMKKYGCNAFTVKCRELCVSNEPMKRKFVPCLTHALLKSEGYPASCEGDINVLVGMMLEMYISGKAAYMGNPIFNRENNTVRICHDSATLKLKGISEPDVPYEIGHFSYEGWGAAIRYDFSRDIGKGVTLARINPAATKLVISKGTIVDGYSSIEDHKSCTGAENVTIKIPSAIEFFHAQSETGHHLAMVYGDCTEELKELGDLMHFEVVEIR